MELRKRDNFVSVFLQRSVKGFKKLFNSKLLIFLRDHNMTFQSRSFGGIWRPRTIISKKTPLKNLLFPLGSGTKKNLEMIFLCSVYVPTSKLGVA